jgi:Protein of unknown function (DUF4232)
VNLTVSSGILGAAAGTQYFELMFRNRAAFACVLTGYPGVSFLDASGRQIGPAAQRNPMTYGSVTLGASMTVYAQVGVGNPDVDACPAATAHEIRVFPPNETVAALVAPPSGLRVCSRQTVTAFVGPVVTHANG